MTAAAVGPDTDLWGARARDWALNEEQQVPVYDEAIRRAGVRPGDNVLEVGCGTGVFLRRAADRGAAVTGLDASPALIDVARERVPEAGLHTGDMQALPYRARSFDVVAGFNSFFFADDMVAALREARRVTRPGGRVVIQVWGRADRCGLDAFRQVLARFRPLAGPPGPELWEPGVLEVMAAAAGLGPVEAFDVEAPWQADDEDTLTRALLSPAPVGAAIREHGEDHVRAAIVDAMERYRRPDGTYQLTNEWHVLIARR